VKGRLKEIRALALSFALLASPAAAQFPVDQQLRPLIPNLIALHSPPANVDFQINSKNYPPAAFPARYLSTVQAFKVFSNAATPWTVQMEVRLRPGKGGSVLPLKQLHFRVNGGPWLDVTGTPQVVMSAIGPTQGWAALNLEFALDLLGNEAVGDAGFDLSFTALALP